MENKQQQYQNGTISAREMLQDYIDAASCDNQRRCQVPQEGDDPGARILERGYEGEYLDF